MKEILSGNNLEFWLKKIYSEPGFLEYIDLSSLDAILSCVKEENGGLELSYYQDFFSLPTLRPKSITRQFLKDLQFEIEYRIYRFRLLNKKSNPKPSQLLLKKCKITCYQKVKCDLVELCTLCPIPKNVEESLQNTVVVQAEIQRKALPPDLFTTYLISEIKKAQDENETINILGHQNQRNNHKIERQYNNGVYTWRHILNIEREKVLSGLMPTAIESEPSIQIFNAKYYALFHWILIELGIEQGFEKNDSGKYRKSDIMLFARTKYPMISSEMFYRAFCHDIDITRKPDIARDFDRGYKQKIISLSKNDSKVILHLRTFPD